jgi:hypothetical protein
MKIKGGFLIAAMVGLDSRATMDMVDTGYHFRKIIHQCQFP